MKKFIAILLLINPSVFAAVTGSITLSGTVPASTSIVVTPQTPYSSLPLTTTQVDTPVANVLESNNTALGYTVKISSANAGLLKNGTIGQMPYTAKYNNVTFALTTLPVTVTNQGPQLVVVNATKALTISYAGVADSSHMQGGYTDTLTFTIASN